MGQFCKPIYLRFDQVELTILALEFMKLRLDKDLAGDSYKFLGKFTVKRINEIIGILNNSLPKPAKP